MRLLLDENIDPRLAHTFKYHEVLTIKGLDLLGIKNGKLKAKCAELAIDVLITNDKTMYYEQPRKGLVFAVVVLFGKSTKLNDLIPLAELLDIEVAKVLQGYWYRCNLDGISAF